MATAAAEAFRGKRVSGSETYRAPQTIIKKRSRWAYAGFGHLANTSTSGEESVRHIVILCMAATALLGAIGCGGSDGVPRTPSPSSAARPSRRRSSTGCSRRRRRTPRRAGARSRRRERPSTGSSATSSSSTSSAARSWSRQPRIGRSRFRTRSSSRDASCWWRGTTGEARSAIARASRNRASVRSRRAPTSNAP